MIFNKVLAANGKESKKKGKSEGGEVGQRGETEAASVKCVRATRTPPRAGASFTTMTKFNHRARARHQFIETGEICWHLLWNFRG